MSDKKLWAVYVHSRINWEQVWKFAAGPYASKQRADLERNNLDRQKVTSSFMVHEYNGDDVLKIHSGRY